MPHSGAAAPAAAEQPSSAAIYDKLPLGKSHSTPATTAVDLRVNENFNGTRTNPPRPKLTRAQSVTGSNGSAPDRPLKTIGKIEAALV
ncbi:hypothetical protein L596_028218 [Steinernema carpocapsae]|uniref:Uncharacterized protein n=1 Tax=Steinernema carpocapsae TaxID=34508 RepID=A0A4U5LXV5_STECR|nr:hypothetical protein L596_028218 [Steinernema carpocapsae]